MDYSSRMAGRNWKWQKVDNENGDLQMKTWPISAVGSGEFLSSIHVVIGSVRMRWVVDRKRHRQMNTLENNILITPRDAGKESDWWAKDGESSEFKTIATYKCCIKHGTRTLETTALIFTVFVPFYETASCSWHRLTGMFQLSLLLASSWGPRLGGIRHNVSIIWVESYVWSGYERTQSGRWWTEKYGF